MESSKFYGRTYRPEISGLRALAVLMVLVYHVEPQLLPGGFLGVDVFLVISGYLITGHLLSDISTGKFKLHLFYARRMRRLFPALFVTVFLTLIAGYFVLYPAAYERLGQSSLAGIFSLANIFFWREAGYFDAAAETKPLLHLWSLSLEEQFYLIWPTICLLVLKLGKKQFFLWVGVFLVLSLLGSVFAYTYSPEGVFYLLPFRMFEFLIGILAVWMVRYPLRNWLVVEGVFLLGIGLILYSAIGLDDKTVMPGLASLIPCFGAVLALYAGRNRYSKFLLTNRPIEIIGLASYSIYLVHWPLLTIYKLAMPGDLSLTTQLVLGVLSIVVGYLMWWGVEQPFRKLKKPIKGLDPIWKFVPFSLLLISAGYFGIRSTNGFSNRYSSLVPFTQEDIMEERDRYWKNRGSIIEDFHDFMVPGEPRKVMVIGNSFSVDLIYALHDQRLPAEVIEYGTSNRCHNFGIPNTPEDEKLCEKVQSAIMNSPHWATVDMVYLVDHWPKFDPITLRQQLAAYRKLTDAPIFVIGPRMIFSKTVHDVVIESGSLVADDINDYAQSFAKVKNREGVNANLINFFKKAPEVINDPKIYYVDFLAIQVEKDGTYQVIDPKNNKLLYWDSGHFTLEGSKRMGELLRREYPLMFDFNKSL